MRRIVLFGYRGTGKTGIGAILAHRLSVPFVDTDVLIEQKSGRTIPGIFKNDGEDHFRALERDVIASLPTGDIVVATGGGAVTDPANMEHLRAKSVCVLLTSDIGTIRKRLAKSPRPPLTSLPRLKRLRRYCPAGAVSMPRRQTSAWTRARHPQKKRHAGSLPFSNRARCPRRCRRQHSGGLWPMPWKRPNSTGSKPC